MVLAHLSRACAKYGQATSRNAVEPPYTAGWRLAKCSRCVALLYIAALPHTGNLGGHKKHSQNENRAGERSLLFSSSAQNAGVGNATNLIAGATFYFADSSITGSASCIHSFYKHAKSGCCIIDAALNYLSLLVGSPLYASALSGSATRAHNLTAIM